VIHDRLVEVYHPYINVWFLLRSDIFFWFFEMMIFLETFLKFKLTHNLNISVLRFCNFWTFIVFKIFVKTDRFLSKSHSLSDLKNWTRVHQNPWNLAIWFIIQYYKTSILLFWPNFGIRKKNRNRYWLCIIPPILITKHFSEGILVIFWFLLHFENFCKYSIF
jgi:hypothetical protein